MVDNTEILGLTLDSTLSWRTHIDTIAPKLSLAGFSLRIVKPFLPLDALKMVYFSFFHSIMTYRIIFWGNSRYSDVIFKIQKIAIRITAGIRSRDSCREHFRVLKILPLQSQFILSLLLFVIDIKDHFRMNSEMHHINTRNKLCLHLCIFNLSVYQQGTNYPGIKVYNSMPSQIRELAHSRHNFKHALKNFLYIHSFYSLDKYFNCKTTYNI